MKLISLFVTTLLMANASFAEKKIKMYFKNEELIKVIELYSKASGQKFVIDPGVRGKVSIFLQEPVSLEDSFNQLSSALAINGFAISKQGDTMIIKSARNIQRDLIEVSTERPSLKPERMFSWIYTPKYLSAGNLQREVRILMSRDGEMVSYDSTNQLIFTDWVSNLNRVADLMKELDKPIQPGTAKQIEGFKKEASQPSQKKSEN